MARQCGEPCVDLWTLFHQEADWRALLSDGLHLTTDGDEAVFAAVRGVIERELPELAPDALPFDLPPHTDITSTAECMDCLAPYLRTHS